MERLDVERLAGMQRERQAAMRREAQTEFLLRREHLGGKEQKVVVKRTLALALVGAVLISAVLIAPWLL